jgi:hypothetical protein
MTHLTLVTAAPPRPATYNELRDAVAAWADGCASLAETILRNLDNGTRGMDLLAGVIEQLREDQALLAALQCVLDHEPV